MLGVIKSVGSGFYLVIASILRPFVFVTSFVVNLVLDTIAFFLGPPYRILRITTRVLYPIYMYIFAAILAGVLIGLVSGTVSEMLTTFFSDRLQNGKVLVGKTATGQLDEESSGEQEWVETKFDDDDDEQSYEVVSTFQRNR